MPTDRSDVVLSTQQVIKVLQDPKSNPKAIKNLFMLAEKLGATQKSQQLANIKWSEVFAAMAKLPLANFMDNALAFKEFYDQDPKVDAAPMARDFNGWLNESPATSKLSPFMQALRDNEKNLFSKTSLAKIKMMGGAPKLGKGGITAKWLAEDKTVLYREDGSFNSSERRTMLIDTPDEHGQTLLHQAAAVCDIQAIQAIVRLQPKYLDAKDKNGKTPAMLAMEQGNLDIMLALREFANIDKNSEELAKSDAELAKALREWAQKDPQRVGQIKAKMLDTIAKNSETNVSKFKFLFQSFPGLSNPDSSSFNVNIFAKLKDQDLQNPIIEKMVSIVSNSNHTHINQVNGMMELYLNRGGFSEAVKLIVDRFGIEKFTKLAIESDILTKAINQNKNIDGRDRVGYRGAIEELLNRGIHAELRHIEQAAKLIKNKSSDIKILEILIKDVSKLKLDAETKKNLFSALPDLALTGNLEAARLMLKNFSASQGDRNIYKAFTNAIGAKDLDMVKTLLEGFKRDNIQAKVRPEDIVQAAQMIKGSNPNEPAVKIFESLLVFLDKQSKTETIKTYMAEAYAIVAGQGNLDVLTMLESRMNLSPAEKGKAIESALLSSNLNLPGKIKVYDYLQLEKEDLLAYYLKSGVDQQRYLAGLGAFAVDLIKTKNLNNVALAQELISNFPRIINSPAIVEHMINPDSAKFAIRLLAMLKDEELYINKNTFTKDVVQKLLVKIFSENPVNKDAVQCLLKNCQDQSFYSEPLLINDKNQLILNIAIEQGNPGLVMDILTRGRVSPNPPLDLNRSPLFNAIKSVSGAIKDSALAKENLKMLEKLCAYGADMQQVNARGLTALAYAVELGNPEVVSIIAVATETYKTLSRIESVDSSVPSMEIPQQLASDTPEIDFEKISKLLNINFNSKAATEFSKSLRSSSNDDSLVELINLQNAQLIEAGEVIETFQKHSVSKVSEAIEVLNKFLSKDYIAAIKQKKTELIEEIDDLTAGEDPQKLKESFIASNQKKLAALKANIASRKDEEARLTAELSTLYDSDNPIMTTIAEKTLSLKAVEKELVDLQSKLKVYERTIAGLDEKIAEAEDQKEELALLRAALSNLNILKGNLERTTEFLQKNQEKARKIVLERQRATLQSTNDYKTVKAPIHDQEHRELSPIFFSYENNPSPFKIAFDKMLADKGKLQEDAKLIMKILFNAVIPDSSYQSLHVDDRDKALSEAIKQAANEDRGDILKFILEERDKLRADDLKKATSRISFSALATQGVAKADDSVVFARKLERQQEQQELSDLLVIAVRKDNKVMLKNLLDRGSNPDSLTLALNESIRLDKISLVAMIVEKGPNIFAKDSELLNSIIAKIKDKKAQLSRVAGNNDYDQQQLTREVKDLFYILDRAVGTKVIDKDKEAALEKLAGMVKNPDLIELRSKISQKISNLNVPSLDVIIQDLQKASFILLDAKSRDTSLWGTSDEVNAAQDKFTKCERALTIHWDNQTIDDKEKGFYQMLKLLATPGLNNALYEKVKLQAEQLAQSAQLVSVSTMIKNAEQLRNIDQIGRGLDNLYIIAKCDQDIVANESRGAQLVKERAILEQAMEKQTKRLADINRQINPKDPNEDLIAARDALVESKKTSEAALSRNIAEQRELKEQNKQAALQKEQILYKHKALIKDKINPLKISILGDKSFATEQERLTAMLDKMLDSEAFYNKREAFNLMLDVANRKDISPLFSNLIKEHAKKLAIESGIQTSQPLVETSEPHVPGTSKAAATAPESPTAGNRAKPAKEREMEKKQPISPTAPVPPSKRETGRY